MNNKKLPTLRIGNLEINPPIIQGGMGVRVSMAGLASAVANEGCVGVIASVGLDKFQILSGRKKEDVKESTLRNEIKRNLRSVNYYLSVLIKCERRC